MLSLGAVLRYLPRVLTGRLKTLAEANDLNLMEDYRKSQTDQHLAAFILGLVFGVALGPCTFAYMAPMLGVTFKVSAAHPVYGASLLAAYGLGHCLVIAAADAGATLARDLINMPNHRAFVRMMIDGAPCRAFSMTTLPRVVRAGRE